MLRRLATLVVYIGIQARLEIPVQQTSTKLEGPAFTRVYRDTKP